VTYRSPSIRSARILYDSKRGVYELETTLKPHTKSGAIILTVQAPASKTATALFEPLNASRRLLVRTTATARDSSGGRS